MPEATESNALLMNGRPGTIADPRQVIASWLAGQRISGRPASPSGDPARRFAGNARMAPDAIGMYSRFVPRQHRGSTHTAAGRTGHALLFDPGPTAYQRSPLSIELPTNPAPRIAEDEGKDLSGGQISDPAADLPEPGRITPSYVGSPNYWGLGPISPADTGTRWGNSIANAFISPANVLINPIVEAGASVAPYSPALDAIEMTMRGLPAHGKLAATPIAGASRLARGAARLKRLTSDNAATKAPLKRQLTLEEANSAFRSDGKLKGRTIAGSKQIIAPEKIANKAVPTEYGKSTTQTFQSPYGDFQVHFYRNPATGDVYYDLDYKTVFNDRSRRKR